MHLRTTKLSVIVAAMLGCLASQPVRAEISGLTVTSAKDIVHSVVKPP